LILGVKLRTEHRNVQNLPSVDGFRLFVLTADKLRGPCQRLVFDGPAKSPVARPADFAFYIVRLSFLIGM